jgi:tetratricopeptide (TPR) repeat protein
MGRKLHRFSAIIGAFLVLCAGYAQPALAGEVEDSIAAAMNDADQSRCAEAYERLAGIEGLEVRARLLAGQCRVRNALYPEALNDLDRIRGSSDLSATQQGNVELYRAVALYHLDRFPESSAALAKAEGQTNEEAQFALYSGLVDLRDAHYERAARSLERGARLSPELTEPIASYYAGLAWQGASERTKARAAFLRVIEVDAEGPWGLEAARRLESTELFPYYVRLSAGVEYDDNVILRGGESQFVQPGTGLQITQDGKKDWRGVWTLETGVELFDYNEWSGGLSASYSGNAHYDLKDFNTHYPTLGGYVARRLGPDTQVQARYQFGFAWVDKNSFLRSHVGEVGLAHTWATAGTTIVVTDVISNDLRFQPRDILDETALGGCAATISGCGPIGLREDHQREQDGIGVGGAIYHVYPVAVSSRFEEFLKDVEIGGGYRIRYYDSEGDEWDHLAHIFSAGIEIELPHDFSVATRASYEFRDFSESSSFPDVEIVGVSYVPLSNQEREEHAVSFEAEIEKDLNEYLSVSVRWSYLDNESNRRVYDYDRHIVGGYLNFRLD